MSALHLSEGDVIVIRGDLELVSVELMETLANETGHLVIVLPEDLSIVAESWEEIEKDYRAHLEAGGK